MSRFLWISLHFSFRLPCRGVILHFVKASQKKDNFSAPPDAVCVTILSSYHGIFERTN